MKYISIFFLFLLSCTKENDALPSTEIVGEWRYVGNFSHLADYQCLICSSYDYENEKYQLNFNSNGEIAAKINLLILKGQYTIQKNKLNIQSFDRLNKPAETPQDGAFISDFLNADLFLISKTDLNYTSLQVNVSKENYLLFVRK